MIFMDGVKRITWLKALVAVSFIVGMFVAHDLWIAGRLYPLMPAFNIFSAISFRADYILSSLLIFFLVLAVVAHKPRKYIIVSLALIAILFLEDRTRMYPSFYEYSLLLLALAWYPWEKGDDRAASPILNCCRLAVACIYFWSGVQKVNPYFGNQLSWFLLPVTNTLPFLGGAFLRAASVIAPILEASIGIELLFKKTRKFALIEALCMHGTIFFLIGPIRGDSNVSAWIWNLCSVAIVLTLFFNEKKAGAKEILFNPRLGVHYVILAFLGILPGLSLVNLWDSPLSFNIYSGNYAQAEIYAVDSLEARLPAELWKYFGPASPIGTGAGSGIAKLDLDRWAADEFRSGPYQEPDTYKNVAKYFCRYAADPSDVRMLLLDKPTIFEFEKGNTAREIEKYNCANL